jgi:2-polyprenyl-6-methoxyphenol hydroxylase-like FAD-dependent oxidoreductase
MERADIVVVGGGIAGASLAYALADQDLEVVVLEASEVFEDRVRGEQMHAWGVREARELGVEQVLLDAGAHVVPLWKQYNDLTDEPTEIPMSMMVPEVDGTLNLRHPDACQALLDAAARAGAGIERGVADVDLGSGQPRGVSYRSATGTHQVDAPLVIGADGRRSTIRRRAGIALSHQPATGYIAGLLLDGLDTVPDDHDVVVAEGDVFFILFHQGSGRARAYLAMGATGQHRFAGGNAAERFLDAIRLDAYPDADAVASATPAGPCATYPGDDTWTAEPYADGVVLIGDAAGYNDPIIGEGLSIAMRDARMVRDLILDGARTPEAFGPYGTERVERMRRLRLIADVVSVVSVEDGGDRRARRGWFGEKMRTMDPQVFPLLTGSFAGPETIPVEATDERILERIRAVDAIER